jgi:hypothetical protein
MSFIDQHIPAEMFPRLPTSRPLLPPWVTMRHDLSIEDQDFKDHQAKTDRPQNWTFERVQHALLTVACQKCQTIRHPNFQFDRWISSQLSCRGPPQGTYPAIQRDFSRHRKKTRMKNDIESQVDDLFATAPDRFAEFGEFRENPVTGGSFVAGLEPIRPQKLRAQRALEARAWFAAQKPDDAPELPLTYNDRESLKVNGLPYIVSLFARSLAYRDYRTEGHPKFDEYARGVMAWSGTPDWIREDTQLLGRYPPEPLNEMASGLIWRGR